jgi:cytochrome c553
MGMLLTVIVSACANCFPGFPMRPPQRSWCWVVALLVAACQRREAEPPLPNIGSVDASTPIPNPTPSDTCNSSAPPPVGLGKSPRPLGPTGGLHDGPLQADTPPPPISGGTLLTTRDGQQLVAADPDRDQLYFIDIESQSLLHVIQLKVGDEPGRLVEDGAGGIHVVLRGGHGIASMTRAADTAVVRREVCDVPRGLAYDSGQQLLHVACAEGRLVSLAVEPDGAVVRSVDLGRDLRDVVVRGDTLFITRFRSAALLSVDAKSGALLDERAAPSLFSVEAPVFPDRDMAQGAVACSAGPQLVMLENTPTVAYRMLDVPGRGITLLHQHARTAEVQTTVQGGYGLGGNGADCGPGIVHSSLSVGVDSTQPLTTDLADTALAVDMAVDPNNGVLAVVAPGNWGMSSQVGLLALTASNGVSDAYAETPDAGTTQPLPQLAGSCLGLKEPVGQPTGQATAVAFTTPYVIAVQQREPAAISFIDLRTGISVGQLDLRQPSRADSGHEMFHRRTSAGIACASCHAEAGDDGHVWSFHGIGARRTQQLRGGILGTEPFHWNGDMQDFPTLVREVFVGRMSGFEPLPEQTDALARWIDRQPELKASPRDPLAAARGRALFESAAVGCSNCHAGAEFTNNATADVGTGAALQVPALRGVAFRTPLMHDGCAKSLAERFDSRVCGGGDSHGHTSQLSSAQIADVIAYVETL